MATKYKIISSLEKILYNREPEFEESSFTVLKGQTHNFQLAFFNEEAQPLKRCRLDIDGEIKKYVKIYAVENVPVTYFPDDADDYYISKELGLYPDLLKPIGKAGLVLPGKQWKAVWVSFCEYDCNITGKQNIIFTLYSENNEKLCELSYTVEIINVKPENNTLILTNWIHYDCICNVHNVKPFGRNFYKVFGNYLTQYVRIGFNMLLTPVFTPPIDTAVGEERKTIQLVDIKIEGDKYIFDFRKLSEFIVFAKSYGIKYFEFNHLYTQWGGTHCPKIIADVNGKRKNIFGWKVRSTDESYKKFITEFLKELYKFITSHGLENSCYFHLTDEPNESSIEMYANHRETIKNAIKNCTIMDALSEFVFYKKGLVDIPVVLISSFEKFRDAETNKLFVYNCCVPANGYYSNRFINMPALRTRVLGVQLYKTGVAGYLHWGYNYYNGFLSLEENNPYLDSCGGGVYPGGDGFIVYPTKKGVYTSIRAELMKEGLQDYNALLTLERLTGKKAIYLVNKLFPIDGFGKYLHDEKAFARFRLLVNKEIKKHSE